MFKNYEYKSLFQEYCIACNGYYLTDRKGNYVGETDFMQECMKAMIYSGETVNAFTFCKAYIDYKGMYDQTTCNRMWTMWWETGDEDYKKLSAYIDRKKRMLSFADTYKRVKWNKEKTGFIGYYDADDYNCKHITKHYVFENKKGGITTLVSLSGLSDF